MPAVGVHHKGPAGPHGGHRAELLLGPPKQVPGVPGAQLCRAEVFAASCIHQQCEYNLYTSDLEPSSLVSF